MITNRCHACHRVSPADAKRCEACGTALAAVIAQPQPLLGLDKSVSSGAIWLDDLTPSQSQDGPARAVATLPGAPPELAITLLEVEAGAPVSAQRSVASALPRGEALVLSNHEPRPRPVCSPSVDEVISQSPQRRTVQAKLKAERRAAVRRSRLGGKPAAHGVSTISEVLVVDAHGGDRDRLCNLLRDFGFWVRAAGRADEAAAHAESRPFVAVFIDVALDAADDGAGLDLCRKVRDAGRRRGGTDTLLILTATCLKPMDRVRAELAGCQESILKPVTRARVAGVLDSRGIALPIDRRQS